MHQEEAAIMKTIILAAGLGERFSQQDYPNPKPATMVNGKPMLVRVAESLGCNSNVSVVLNRIHRGWRIGDLLAAAGMGWIECIELTHTTRGPAETLLFALDGIGDDENVLVLDCDVMHPSFIYEESSNSREGIVFCFQDVGQTPMFSYVSCKEDGHILDIAEKQKISDQACSGAYYFPNAKALSEACRAVIRAGEFSQGEFYLSNVIAHLLRAGVSFRARTYSPYHCLGTPEQLQDFCGRGDFDCASMRFCFDLDGTLVSHPRIKGDYASVAPIEENINYLRFLKERGAHIIIYTARRMRTHNGDVSKVIADVGELTKATLERFSIPYDELIFGKPWANFYVDDLAVPAWAELGKWTGVHTPTVSSRKNNVVQIKKDHVIKNTSNDGESFFYRNMPESIKCLFPQIISIKENEIKMEKVEGESASHLYARGKMSHEDLLEILHALEAVHNCGEPEKSSDVLLNYLPKLEHRASSYNYHALGLDEELERVKNELSEGIGHGLYVPAVIHGDPVFSNIFIGGGIKFIDPRGKLGDKPSISGDAMYDFGKIFQSLSGYDAILVGKNIPANRENLMDYFHAWFVERFGSSRWGFVKSVAKSHMLSLMPIHDDNNVPRFISLYRDYYQCLTKR